MAPPLSQGEGVQSPLIKKINVKTNFKPSCFRDIGKPLLGPTRYESVGCDDRRFIFPKEFRLRIWGGLTIL